MIVASKIDGGKYADSIKKSKSLVCPHEFGLQIAKMHYMRKGEMLLKLKRFPQKAGDIVGFTNQLQEVLSVEADMKKPQWNTTLLLLDIEESVSAKEIPQAVVPLVKSPLRK